jgi:hypothetical protein
MLLRHATSAAPSAGPTKSSPRKTEEAYAKYDAQKQDDPAPPKGPRSVNPRSGLTAQVQDCAAKDVQDASPAYRGGG